MYLLSLIYFITCSSAAIETIFNEENQPLFNRACLRKYLVTADIACKFKNLTTMAQSKFLSDLKNHKAAALVQWLSKKVVEKIEEKHQQAIEGHEQRIVLFNDDLQDGDRQKQAIQYGNVGLPGEIRAKNKHIKKCESTINHLREHYFDLARDPGKDSIFKVV